MPAFRLPAVRPTGVAVRSSAAFRAGKAAGAATAEKVKDLARFLKENPGEAVALLASSSYVVVDKLEELIDNGEVKDLPSDVVDLIKKSKSMKQDKHDRELAAAWKSRLDDLGQVAHLMRRFDMAGLWNSEEAFFKMQSAWRMFLTMGPEDLSDLRALISGGRR